MRHVAAGIQGAVLKIMSLKAGFIPVFMEKKLQSEINNYFVHQYLKNPFTL